MSAGGRRAASLSAGNAESKPGPSTSLAALPAKALPLARRRDAPQPGIDPRAPRWRPRRLALGDPRPHRYVHGPPLFQELLLAPLAQPPAIGARPDRGA